MATQLDLWDTPAAEKPKYDLDSILHRAADRLWCVYRDISTYDEFIDKAAEVLSETITEVRTNEGW